MAGVLLMLSVAALAAPEGGVADEYARRAARIGAKDARAWLELAAFSESRQLLAQREDALRKALAADPDHAEAHARLDEVRVGRAWLPAGEAEAAEAREQEAKGLAFYGAKWRPPAEAEKLRKVDRVTVGWDFTVRVDTRRLTVYSGRSLADTRRLAGLLENALAAYVQVYGKVWKLNPNPTPFKVYFFGDRETFTRVLKAETGRGPSEAQSGLYMSESQVLYAGRSVQAGGGEDFHHATAVHEMTHAMDHLLARLLSDWPLWLAEGRAEHLGQAVLGRQVVPGLVRVPPGSTRFAELREAMAGIRLEQLLAANDAQFSGERGLQYYAMSWAWVHFLFHAEEGRRPGRGAAFRTFLAGCPGRSSTADFEKAVGKLSELEPAFRKYVEGTLMPLEGKP